MRKISFLSLQMLKRGDAGLSSHELIGKTEEWRKILPTRYLSHLCLGFPKFLQMRPHFYSKLQAKLSQLIMYFWNGPQSISRQTQSSAMSQLKGSWMHLRSQDYPSWLDLDLVELCTTLAAAVPAPLSELPNSRATVALRTPANLWFSQKFCLESLERVKKEALLFWNMFQQTCWEIILALQ